MLFMARPPLSAQFFIFLQALLPADDLRRALSELTRSSQMKRLGKKKKQSHLQLMYKLMQNNHIIPVNFINGVQDVCRCEKT